MIVLGVAIIVFGMSLGLWVPLPLDVLTLASFLVGMAGGAVVIVGLRRNK